MFRKNKIHYVLALGTLVTSACAVDVRVDEVGATAQALDSCDTTPGKWRQLANLAVATAQELGQLNVTESYTLVPWNGGEKVALSTYGASLCEARGGCPIVQGLLGLQEVPNDILAPRSVFDTDEYRNEMVENYRHQVTNLDQLVKSNRWSELPEDNATTFIGKDGTAACGTPWYAFGVTRSFSLKFSSEGAIPGMSCTPITEPMDEHGWTDNYLCSERPLGLRWSSQGAIDGMVCVNVNEPSEAAWSDNYLCSPEDWGLSFSHSGIPEGKQCISFNEPSDPNGWVDNYLCWDPSANLNHPSTLCQEFTLFGGAGLCGGDNPYVDFVVADDGAKFKIDPTDYNQGIYHPITGVFCTTAIPLVTTDLVEGLCCYSGQFGTLRKFTSIPYTYYCGTV